MTEKELKDWSNELSTISNKISDLARDLADDKYSTNIPKIKQHLESCKTKLEFVISNLQ